MTEDLTFFEAVTRTATYPGLDYPGSRPMTAYYPSAGRDTNPIALLRPTWLRRHGIDMPWPSVFVYVDRLYPVDPANDRLGGPAHAAIPMRTRDIEPLLVEGFPASIVTVELGRPTHGRVVRVLRIRAENHQGLTMCRRASWSPQFYIAPDDGCCFGGGNYNRCENSVDPMNTPMRAFLRPPLWWITDHFSPRTPDGEYPDGALIPTVAGFPFEVRKIAHMPVERWGHDWDPFGGTTAFELTDETQSAGSPELLEQARLLPRCYSPLEKSTSDSVVQAPSPNSCAVVPLEGREGKV